MENFWKYPTQITGFWVSFPLEQIQLNENLEQNPGYLNMEALKKNNWFGLGGCFLLLLTACYEGIRVAISFGKDWKLNLKMHQKDPNGTSRKIMTQDQ